MSIKQGAGVVILHEGRIAVSRRIGTKAFNGFLQIPGGLVDEGENPLQAAVRELREETGYILPNEGRYVPRLLGSYDLHYSNGEPYKYFAYVVTLEQGYENVPILVNKEPLKSTAWTWMTPTEILREDFIPCVELLLQVDQLSRMLADWKAAH